MTGHTKGPWKAVESRKNEWFVSSDDIDIARILHNGKPHPDGTRGMNNAMGANARLIAAAPDMYELLQDALKVIQTHIPVDQAVCRPGISRDIRNLLNKIEGKG